MGSIGASASVFMQVKFSQSVIDRVLIALRYLKYKQNNITNCNISETRGYEFVPIWVINPHLIEIMYKSGSQSVFHELS